MNYSNLTVTWLTFRCAPMQTVRLSQLWRHSNWMVNKVLWVKMTAFQTSGEIPLICIVQKENNNKNNNNNQKQKTKKTKIIHFIEWHTWYSLQWNVQLNTCISKSRGQPVGPSAHLSISLTKKSYFKKKERRTKDKLLIEVKITCLWTFWFRFFASK